VLHQCSVQAPKPAAKNFELLWNRPESLLLKILSYCGTSILPAAKNLVDKRNNSNKSYPK
jgi:hypothetical protein